MSRTTTIRIALWFILMNTLTTCVDPFDLGVSGTEPNLIVEALIHSGPGPYRVRLYRAVDLINPAAEQNAQVSVTDDLNMEYLFTEVEAGVYQSPGDFQGAIGRTYTLNISTSNGTQYRSSPETMLPVTPINSIYLRQTEQVEVSGMGNEITTEGFNILVDTRSGPSGPSYYRWDYRGVFTLVTPDPCDFVCPISCFIMDTPTELLRVFGTTQPNVPINGVSLGFFTTGIEWESSYRIFVRQYSLTQKGYDFWKAVDDQRVNTGSIFDPPPSIIVGNVAQTGGSQEPILGFFQVSGVEEQLLVITRADINELSLLFPNSFAPCDPGPNDPPAPEYCVNCLAYPDSSIEFPEDIW